MAAGPATKPRPVAGVVTIANPSFLVDPSKSLFDCYGCGRGGDVIRLTELYRQVRFPQALALLQQWRGLPPLLRQAADFYRMQLHRHSEAVAYLYQRGVRSPELIDDRERFLATTTVFERWGSYCARFTSDWWLWPAIFCLVVENQSWSGEARWLTPRCARHIPNSQCGFHAHAVAQSTAGSARPAIRREGMAHTCVRAFRILVGGHAQVYSPAFAASGRRIRLHFLRVEVVRLAAGDRSDARRR